MASMDYSAKARRRAIQNVRYGELKVLDTVLDTTDVSTTSIITCIDTCQVGSDVDDRVGREILLKSVQVRGVLFANGANPGGTVFWAIVYDRQTNAAAPVWTDVYTTNSYYPALRNLDNRKRFKIIGSGYIAVPKAGADIPSVPFEFYRKLRHSVEYNSTNGGTVADIQTGGLFFMIRANAALGADDYTLVATSRVRFTDN